MRHYYCLTRFRNSIFKGVFSKSTNIIVLWNRRAVDDAWLPERRLRFSCDAQDKRNWSSVCHSQSYNLIQKWGNFLALHSLFSPIKNKNTIFFLREKVLIFFTFNSPFLSEKCMKCLKNFKAHMKIPFKPVRSVKNLNSRLFIEI